MNDVQPLLCVVVPVHDEEENIAPLAQEIFAALELLDGVTAEVVFVDDASRDGTVEQLRSARTRFGPALRIISHRHQAGQSAAIHTGVTVARGAWIATLDGDGQNDPAEIVTLWSTGWADGPPPGLVAGNRRRRRDTWVRRASSRIANGVRRAFLKDGCPDTGCGLKLFSRESFLALPRFDHMHRFLPALYARDGKPVLNVPVSHRPRERGRSKYGIGNRLGVGIVDLFGVAWLRRRRMRVEASELLTDGDPQS